MDILRIIESDHEKILDILSELRETSTGAPKTRVDGLTKLKEALLPHMEAEEELFYPFLLEEGDDRQAVLRAIEEHNAAKKVLSELETTSPGDERWAAKLQLLSEMLDHHIENEQDELFDMAHDLLDEARSDEMAGRFQSLKEEAKAHI